MATEYIIWGLGVVVIALGWCFKQILNSKEEVKMLNYKCTELGIEAAKIEGAKERITVVETRLDSTNIVIGEIKGEIRLVNESITKMGDEQRNFQLTSLEIMSAIKTDIAGITR